MDLFHLPSQTIVNRVIPKNQFDSFTNTKEKKLFSELVGKIIWANKLSADTVNLEGKRIQEIQIIRIELRKHTFIPKILEIFDKHMPYHLIFSVWFEEQVYLSTSSKHEYPTNPNLSVIDWTFTTDWIHYAENPFRINLRGSLDETHLDFCGQLSGVPGRFQKLPDLLEHTQKRKALQREIQSLESAIRKSNQFNRKVELNMRLREVREELERMD